MKQDNIVTHYSQITSNMYMYMYVMMVITVVIAMINTQCMIEEDDDWLLWI